ncbi:Dehydrogenase/oxidoreductase [uncultured virus]|nr:Dehydrogenase/oxidoreductase [uncultured virus]
MYRVIQSIIANPIYPLQIVDKPSIDTLRRLSNFSKSPFKLKACLRLLNTDPGCLGPLLHTLPFTYLIELVIKYDFLHNYWSEDIIQSILHRSAERFRIKVINNEDYTDDLILMNNMFNLQYNFTDNVFMPRLEPYKFLERFYIGTSMTLFLARVQKRGVLLEAPTINQEAIIINQEVITINQENKPDFLIYPRDIKVNLKIFIDHSDFENIEECPKYLIVTMRQYRFLIPRFYYSNIGTLLLTTEEGLVIDGDKIWATPKFYQTLGNEVLSNRNISMIHNEEVKPFKYHSKTMGSPTIPKFKTFYCYICKKPSDPVYSVDGYQSMCLECGLFNLDKRILTTNLGGITALVTGIRQKIGRSVALKLLRCGARVIGTTRFPQATWYNYSCERDFNEWRDRLLVYKCNFFRLIEVQQLIEFIKTQSVSVFINNACQTIRSSEIYRTRLLQLEQLLSDTATNDSQLEFRNTDTIEFSTSTELSILPNQTENSLVPWTGISGCEISTILKNNDLSLNSFGDIQDIDIKANSSWNMTIELINSEEIMEATIVNQLVPTLIINQLRPFMCKPSFIIQCTALEGSFNTDKNAYHAHSNMCKAAMNMLIRTMSEEPVCKNGNSLYVYSINPGFVSGVNANPETTQFPLSPDDAASRILDPIIQYYRGTPLPKEWVILKNYHSTSW